jgi:hypothetical protein
MSRYERLLAQVQRLQEDGTISRTLTAQERADWAYGNAVIENADVTREMARRAVETSVDE